MTLSAQILLSLVFGLAAGLFFGELTRPLEVVGNGFILLLQMTVLPYVDESLAFIVPDHDRDAYSTREAVQALDAPKIAVPSSPYYIEKLHHYLPNAVVTIVDSPRDFFRAEPGTFDALLFTAESGSAWSLVYPAFTVAIPQPDILRVPLAYMVRSGDARMVEFLTTWIMLKHRDRTIELLFDHWILGKATRDVEPRWSVIRDVLGWVD